LSVVKTTIDNQIKGRTMKGIKAFILLLAVLALGAVAAPVATAADTFTAEQYPVTLTGTPDESAAGIITSTAGTMACTGVLYQGVVEKASSTVSATPSFSGCTFFGFSGTVDMNGCSYLFHLSSEGTKGTADIVCPEGKEITGTGLSAGTAKCTMHVKPQTGLSEVIFKNIGAGATRELTAEVNLKNIHYTHTQGTGLGTCSSGTGTNGTLSSKLKFTGETGGGAHIGLFLS
jgi:hypothetical protein